MIGFILRVLFAAAGLWLAARLVPGIAYATPQTLIVAGLILGVVNAVVRPVVFWLTLPLTLMTLGLFLLVINGLMLLLTAAVLEGFTVQSFTAALLGAVVVGVVSWIGSVVTGR